LRWLDDDKAALLCASRSGLSTIVFADGRRFLDYEVSYEVFEDLQVVVIDILTWLE
jgi:hypothetical protein